MKKRIRYLLFLGAFASSPVIAQTYMNVENASGIDSYTLDDVQTLTFTSTDLNVSNTSGMAPYVMDDVVKVYFSNSVGINEAIKEQSVLAYPNPTTGELTLNVDYTTTGVISVDVYSTLGSVMFTNTYGSNGGNLNIRLDMSNYENGIYFVRINSGESTVTKRVIKQ